MSNFIPFLVALNIISIAPGIKDYFKAFPHRPDSVPLEENEHTRITLDEKNAYMSISYDDPDYSFEYGGQLQFTYFVKADKQKIFGYCSFGEGPSSEFASYSFYTYQNGQWNEVSPLEDLTLELFTTNSEMIEKVNGQFRVRVVLPQHGTILMPTLFPSGKTTNRSTTVNTWISSAASQQ